VGFTFERGILLEARNVRLDRVHIAKPVPDEIGGNIHPVDRHKAKQPGVFVPVGNVALEIDPFPLDQALVCG